MDKIVAPYCLYEEGEVIDTTEHSENWASVANYVEPILRLKQRALKAAEHVGVSAYMILAHVSNGNETGAWTKGIVEKLRCFLNIRYAIRTRM